MLLTCDIAANCARAVEDAGVVSCVKKRGGFFDTRKGNGLIARGGPVLV